MNKILGSRTNRQEIVLGFALLTQLQWLFGNIYEEVLTPNSITASIASLNCYNAFFKWTEPYFYYIPLTQAGCLTLLWLAIWPKTERVLKPLLVRAAVFGSAALLLTAFIVIHYNVRMFFGSVDHLGSAVHRLYFEWAAFNAVRIVLVGCECAFAFKAYRLLLTRAQGARDET